MKTFELYCPDLFADEVVTISTAGIRSDFGDDVAESALKMSIGDRIMVSIPCPVRERTVIGFIYRITNNWQDRMNIPLLRRGRLPPGVGKPRIAAPTTTR